MLSMLYTKQTSTNPPLSTTKMRTRTAFFARVIDDVETRRRRLYRNAVCQLISNKSTFILLVPRRHRRVLPYEPSSFQLDNYIDD